MAKQRSIKAEKSSGPMSHCVRVTANAGGRATRWTVCAIGVIGEPASLSVHRRGRVGGARSADRNPGGMVACSAKGERSKCVRAPSGVVLFPGGGAKLKKKGVPVLDGYRKPRRKKR